VQLRRFFGMLRAMFKHWPEGAEFQPDSAEHLRKWALIKAGHREATDIPLEWAEEEPSITRLTSLAIEFAIMAAGSYAFVRPDANGGRVRVFTAKSIAYAKLEQPAFNQLNDEVDAVLRAETGLDPSQVLTEEEKAA
jgi:hypothetical protein